MIRPIQIYLDTSVINFLFADDSPEKRDVTIDFFENYIKPGVYESFVSDFVLEEILQTRNLEKRNRLMKVVDDYYLTRLESSDISEVQELAMKYLSAGALPEKNIMDALHVALAVTQKIPYLVSWNYKHLANINKEMKIRMVNLSLQYSDEIRILTPYELVGYGS